MSKRFSILTLYVGSEIFLLHVKVTFDLKSDLSSLRLKDDVHAPVVEGVGLFDVAVSNVVAVLVEVFRKCADKLLVRHSVKQQRIIRPSGTPVKNTEQQPEQSPGFHLCRR